MLNDANENPALEKVLDRSFKAIVDTIGSMMFGYEHKLEGTLGDEELNKFLESSFSNMFFRDDDASRDEKKRLYKYTNTHQNCELDPKPVVFPYKTPVFSYRVKKTISSTTAD